MHNNKYSIQLGQIYSVCAEIFDISRKNVHFGSFVCTDVCTGVVIVLNYSEDAHFYAGLHCVLWNSHGGDYSFSLKSSTQDASTETSVIYET